jgi:hypothetical protein
LPRSRSAAHRSSRPASRSVVAHELGYRAQLGASLAVSATAFQNNYYHLRSTGITPATLLPFVFENNLEGDTHASSSPRTGT